MRASGDATPLGAAPRGRGPSTFARTDTSALRIGRRAAPTLRTSSSADSESPERQHDLDSSVTPEEGARQGQGQVRSWKDLHRGQSPAPYPTPSNMRLVRCHALAPAGLSRWDETWLRARCADAAALSECDKAFKPRTSSVPARLPCPRARAFANVPLYRRRARSTLTAACRLGTHVAQMRDVVHFPPLLPAAEMSLPHRRRARAVRDLRPEIPLPSTSSCPSSAPVGPDLRSRSECQLAPRSAETAEAATTSQIRNSIALHNCEAG